MPLLLFLLACRCGDDRAGAPSRTPGQPIEDPPDPSALVVPLSLPLADLERILDGELPTVLVDQKDTPTKQDGSSKRLLDIRVERLGRPELSGLSDGRVRLVLPLAANIRAHKGKGKGVVVTAAMRVAADIDMGIVEDWVLDPDLALSYEWLENPKLEIAGVKLGIKNKVDKRLEPKLPEIAAKVEDALRESDKLRTKVAEVWEKLGQPHRTKGDPPGWFAIQPDTVYLSRLTADATDLHLSVGLKGAAALGLGDPPPLEALPLPAISPPPPGAAGLRLPIDIGLAWDDLSKLASAELAKQQAEPIEAEGVAIDLSLLDGVRIYPSGDRIAIGLDYTHEGDLWTSDGTAWLLAEPLLDAKARSLRLDNFDYTVDTWDLAVDAANADVVRDAVRDALAERLVFDYGSRIDEVLEKTNARLRELDLPKGGGTLNAHIRNVEVRGVTLLDEALLVRTHVTGSAEVALTAPPKPAD